MNHQAGIPYYGGYQGAGHDAELNRSGEGYPGAGALGGGLQGPSMPLPQMAMAGDGRGTMGPPSYPPQPRPPPENATRDVEAFNR